MSRIIPFWNGAAATPLRRFWLVVLLGVLTAGGPLANDTFIPSMPNVTEVLGSPVGLTQLTITVFQIGLGGGQLIWGPISDRVGRRTPLLLGLTLFVIAAILCAFAPNIWILIIGRFLLGFAASSAVVLGRAIARDLYAAHELPRIYGNLAVVFGATTMIGPIVGTWMLQLGDWRFAFAAIATMGAIVLLASGFGVRESLRPELRIHGRSAERRDAWLAPLRNGVFVVNTLVLVGAATSLTAYLTFISFVLKVERGVDDGGLAILYLLNSAGVMLGGFAARFLEVRLGAHRALPLLLIVNLVAASGVVAASAFDWPLWALMINVWCTVFIASTAVPLTLALALEPFTKGAGTAAAIAGAAQLAVAATIAGLVAVVFGPDGVVLGLLQLSATVVTLGLLGVVTDHEPLSTHPPVSVTLAVRSDVDPLDA